MFQSITRQSPEVSASFRRAAAHPRHAPSKMLLEAALMCWLFAGLTLHAALSDDAQNQSIDAGFYDLQRAHSERAIVIFGDDLSFRKYYIVRMLNQFFTVETRMPGGEEYRLKNDGKTKTIIIY